MLSVVKEIVKPNLVGYESLYNSFDWLKEQRELMGAETKSGFNIGYLAVDRHCNGVDEEKTAIRWIKKNWETRDFTYKELKDETSKFANLLVNLGIKKGDRVFSLLGRIPELYIAAIGTLKTTAIFCPMFSVFGPEPVFQRLSKGDASILVTTSELFNKTVKQILPRLPGLKYVLITGIESDINEKVFSLKRLMEISNSTFSVPYTEPETPALLHFTSGTTGMPKGALHVHGAALMHYVTGKYVLDFHPGDVFWCTADPGWVTGTSYGIISPLVHGITNIVDEEEFDAMRWYGLLEKEKVNVWYTSPTAIRRLMRVDVKPIEKYDLSSLRLILSVGEPLHAEAVEWGKRAFNMPILDNWWQTETGGIMIANYRSVKVKPGSMGKPLPGIKAAIAEVEGNDIRLINEPNKQGNLVLKKDWPSMFREYLHDEERYKKCFRGEWYITGDLAKRDEEGYYWFVGRADDIIKTSGHMVGPFEVESALMSHPYVAEAAIIGKPEPLIGELVKAFIVLKPGVADTEETKMDIMGFARKKLGPAVAPKEISFVKDLPKTRSGKILRRLLKARELGQPEGDISTLEQS